MGIAQYIEHTILKPDTTIEDVKKLCEDARTYGFAGVCVPPPFVRNARKLLHGTDIKLVTVIGFPFGYSCAKAKIFENAQAIEDGADEIDMVINIAAMKNGQWAYLESEVKHILDACHKNGKILKLIIESGILTDEEIIRCCEVYGSLGVDFLKTSTGYAPQNATTHAVSLMREHLPQNIRIKASGGIRTYNFARELIGAGADRLGCSGSIAIVKEEQAQGGV
jgi:deoxyribose-phosphate aldolase